MIVKEMGTGLSDPQAIEGISASFWPHSKQDILQSRSVCWSGLLVWLRTHWYRLFQTLERTKHLKGKFYIWVHFICFWCLNQRSLATTEHLNIIMNDGTVDSDVWAIGDASRIEGNALPATAQGTELDQK